MINERQQTAHDDALLMAYMRNESYRKKYHVILGIFGLCLVGIIALTSMLIFLIKNPPHPLYFVADPVGRLIQDIPIQNPNMTVDQVGAWVTEAVQAAYSYDFLNYRNEIQSAQKYFTNYGWRNYMNGLKASNNLLALTQRKFIVIAKVVQAPQLTGQGHMGVPYAYKFRVQLLVMYWEPPYTDTSKFYNPLIVNVIVARQSLLSSYKGLGILQMNAELVSSGAPQNINPSQG